MPFLYDISKIQSTKPQPYKGRAYIICIGISQFENPIWNLPFAAGDAQYLHEHLCSVLIAGQKFDAVGGVTLTSPANTTNISKTVSLGATTKNDVHCALMILAGKGDSLSPEQYRRVDPQKQLRQTTPDDLVVVSFATHGFNEGSEFYLLSADTGPDRGQGKRITPELKKNAIGTTDLAYWLRSVDAGDMVLIMDACHSAAATGPDFKPGPMGSRGLGQLAYDKGMRLLASTQADSQAFEIGGKLQRGLLTYALVDEGLSEDRLKERRLTLDAWLNTAVEAVPRLHERVKSGNGFTTPKGELVRVITRDGVEDSAAKRNPALQQPVLFNFANRLRQSRTIQLLPK